MQKKENFLPFFLVFFGISLVLILFGTSGIYRNLASLFNRVSEPGRNITNILTLKSIQNSYTQKLTEENLKLKKAMSDQKNILSENAALRNQFESAPEKSQSLLPAKVISAPGFMPGVSLPDYLIINKGEKAGVKKGDTIISSNYLVGKVINSYPDISRVELITSKNSSFTAKVESETAANGIIKGQGGDEMVLDNVLLTTKLQKDGLITTKGDMNEKGEGYPPDISIGKIISIEKKQSDLFQKARILSPVDFKNLNIVFVLK